MQLRLEPRQSTSRAMQYASPLIAAGLTAQVADRNAMANDEGDVGTLSVSECTDAAGAAERARDLIISLVAALKPELDF